MARVLRGEIRWADLNPAQGREQAGFPLTLELGSAGLPKRSWVTISQIRMLSVDRIGRKVGRAAPEVITRVIEGLNEIIGE